MWRQHNTTTGGGSFSQATIDAVWQKGHVVPGYDPNDYRKDRCGAWMRKASYGTTGDYGWEIDHAKPVARGGADDMSNLQPLHWRNNRGKGDDYPNWNCTASARS
jgi:5-methylcytosine-specific restriction endonuclease McrA